MWGSRHCSHSCSQSISPTRSQQSGSVGLAACHHSVCSHATKGGEESSSKSEPSHIKEDAANKDENAEAHKHGAETASDGHMASDGKEELEHPPTQDTLAGISQVFGTHKDTDPKSHSREKIKSIWQKQCPKSLKEDSPQGIQ